MPKSLPRLWIAGAALAVAGLVALGVLTLGGGNGGETANGAAHASTETKSGGPAPNVKEVYQTAEKSRAPDGKALTKTAESKNSSVPVNVAGAPKTETGLGLDAIVIGNPAAPVTIYEYASFTCPHCASFHNETLPKLKENYINAGKAKLIFRPFSLNGFDVYAGLLVACLPAERRTAMVDVLFKQQGNWLPPRDTPEGEVKQKLLLNLKSYASKANIAEAQFDTCMASTEAQSWLQATMNEAQKMEISSTPTFVINGKKHTNMGFDGFKKVLDPLVK